MRFGVQRHPDRARAVVEIEGALIRAAEPMLRERLSDLVTGGYQRITVDLTRLDICEPSAIGVFVGVHRRLAQMDGDLELAHVPPEIRRQFEVRGLDRILHLS